MIHVDAYTDLYGPVLSARIHHGNPFLNAVEEELIDCAKEPHRSASGERAIAITTKYWIKILSDRFLKRVMRYLNKK